MGGAGKGGGGGIIELPTDLLLTESMQCNGLDMTYSLHPCAGASSGCQGCDH